jgi:hypothetical protein
MEGGTFKRSPEMRRLALTLIEWRWFRNDPPGIITKV